jgi:hypothetical protein
MTELDCEATFDRLANGLKILSLEYFSGLSMLSTISHEPVCIVKEHGPLGGRPANRHVMFSFCDTSPVRFTLPLVNL